MNEIQHTPECVEFTKQALYDRWLYTSRWPLFCRSCGGFGYITSWESPDGSGYQVQTGDVCFSCVDTGKCPRCGAKTLLDENGDVVEPLACRSCKWDEQTPGAPGEPDYCGCGEPDDPPTLGPNDGIFYYEDEMAYADE